MYYNPVPSLSRKSVRNSHSPPGEVLTNPFTDGSEVWGAPSGAGGEQRLGVSSVLGAWSLSSGSIKPTFFLLWTLNNQELLEQRKIHLEPLSVAGSFSDLAPGMLLRAL